MKILDGQGLPWPKPPGLKRLATFEKTRVVVLRLLETKLGLRRSSELATSVDTEILLVVSWWGTEEKEEEGGKGERKSAWRRRRERR